MIFLFVHDLDITEIVQIIIYTLVVLFKLLKFAYQWES